MCARLPECPSVGRAGASQSSPLARQYQTENPPCQSYDRRSTDRLGRLRAVSGPATNVPVRDRLHTGRPRWPASAADPTRPESGRAKVLPTSDAVPQGDVHWRRDDCHRESSRGIPAPAVVARPAGHLSPGPLAAPHPGPAPPKGAIPHGLIYHTLLGLRRRAVRPALDRRHAHWAGLSVQPVPSGRPRRKTVIPAYTVLRRCVQTTHRSCRHCTDFPTRRAPSRRSVFAPQTARTLSPATSPSLSLRERALSPSGRLKVTKNITTLEGLGPMVLVYGEGSWCLFMGSLW